MQDLHIDVALLSETHLKPYERFYMLYIVQKEEFPIRGSKCDTYTWRKAKHIHKRQTHLLVREDVSKDFYRRGSVEKKTISGREPQGAWRQDEMIGGKSPVVK
jgi:hypothetical protein